MEFRPINIAVTETEAVFSTQYDLNVLTSLIASLSA